MADNEEIMNGLRTELKRAVAQRYKRIDLDRFKQELKDHVTHYLFEKTQGSPIVIPVINLVGSNGNSQPKKENGKEVKPKTNEEIVADQQKRFQEMRERLLSQDAAND